MSDGEAEVMRARGLNQAAHAKPSQGWAQHPAAEVKSGKKSVNS